jgi:hypothetical protein
MTLDAHDGRRDMAIRIQYLNVISCKAPNMLASHDVTIASHDVTMLLIAFFGRHI